jgi:hypothetical protein
VRTVSIDALRPISSCFGGNLDRQLEKGSSGVVYYQSDFKDQPTLA